MVGWMGDEDGWVDGDGTVWMATAVTGIRRAACVSMLVVLPDGIKRLTSTKIDNGKHDDDERWMQRREGVRERDQRTTTPKQEKKRTSRDLFRAGHDGLRALAPLKRMPNSAIAEFRIVRLLNSELRDC